VCHDRPMKRKFNERKALTLEYFSSRRWTRPRAYGVALGIYPTRAVYSYLLRLHRWRYLHRGRDVRGQIVYKLSPRGAQWLLRRRAQGVRFSP